jgi:hypothetical protein
LPFGVTDSCFSLTAWYFTKNQHFQLAMTCVPAYFLSVQMASAGLVTFFTDEVTWLRQTGLASISNFEITAENVALADEVSSPPAIGSRLGPVLTFQASNTGLPFDFAFRSENPGTEVIYTDPVGQILGLGSTPTRHHDWSVAFGMGRPVLSIGMEMSSRSASFVDAIRVFDTSDMLIASLPLGNTQGGFFGIFSNAPIGRILYDDNPAPGGKVLTRLALAVPEPSGLMLFAGGIVLLWLAARYQRASGEGCCYW